MGNKSKKQILFFLKVKEGSHLLRDTLIKPKSLTFQNPSSFYLPEEPIAPTANTFPCHRYINTKFCIEAQLFLSPHSPSTQTLSSERPLTSSNYIPFVIHEHFISYS